MSAHCSPHEVGRLFVSTNVKWPETKHARASYDDVGSEAKCLFHDKGNAHDTHARFRLSHSSLSLARDEDDGKMFGQGQVKPRGGAPPCPSPAAARDSSRRFPPELAARRPFGAFPCSGQHSPTWGFLGRQRLRIDLDSADSYEFLEEARSKILLVGLV
jgi:hypothetical protein